MPRFPENPDEVRMSLGEHLEELRRRVILALLGMGLAFFACLYFGKPLVQLMVQPVYDAIYTVEHGAPKPPAGQGSGTPAAGQNPPAREPLLVVLTPVELFTTTMKAVFVAAAVISSPWVLYQFWLFVASGLYPHERRIIQAIVPMSAVLFVAGAVFSYTVVMKYGLLVLLTFGGLTGDMVRTTIRLSSAIDFVLVLSLVMGAVFQLPLVMLALSKVGLIRPEVYVKQWRYAVAAIFIIAAVLTPPDAVTQIAMAVPMLFLYWLGVGLCKIFVKKPK
jgi:sec-independent protein translocase protein TatC